MPNRFQSPVALPVVMVVVVVDDQSANVQVVGQLLTQANYDVIPVLDGREALALAERTPPDRVLLDMRMPGLDGFAVLEGLQALPQARDVLVVLLTADHERDDQEDECVVQHDDAPRGMDAGPRLRARSENIKSRAKRTPGVNGRQHASFQSLTTPSRQARTGGRRTRRGRRCALCTRACITHAARPRAASVFPWNPRGYEWHDI